MGLDQHKIIRTSRLLIACLMLFLITWYYQIPESAWCLLTLWIVMSENTTVGGVLNKSMLRLAGTFLSALYGLIVVYCCGNNPLINMLAMIPGLFIYSYFFMSGDKAYIGTVGGLTLTLVLLNYNHIDIAILRTTNILIGVVAALFMMRFFYPQYARDNLIELQWDFLEAFSQQLQDYLDDTIPLISFKETYLQKEHEIFERFAAFKRNLSEAKMETLDNGLLVNHHREAFERIKNLFRLFNVFLLYVTTNDIRTHLNICNQLRHLLGQLQVIKQIFISTGADAAITLKPLQIDTPTASIEPPPKGLKPKRIQGIKFIEAIVSHMSQEMDLLEKDIRHIMSLYQSYHVQHQVIEA